MVAMRTIGILIILLIATGVLIQGCGPVQYTLSTSVSPSGAGTISPASGTYDAGTEVTLTASPAEGYVFDHWSGDVAGTSSSIAVTIDSDKSVIAHFSAHVSVQYTLSTSVSPSGAGKISPADGTYDASTEVTLTATPTEGYVFDLLER